MSPVCRWQDKAFVKVLITEMNNSWRLGPDCRTPAEKTLSHTHTRPTEWKSTAVRGEVDGLTNDIEHKHHPCTLNCSVSFVPPFLAFLFVTPKAITSPLPNSYKKKSHPRSFALWVTFSVKDPALILSKKFLECHHKEHLLVLGNFMNAAPDFLGLWAKWRFLKASLRFKGANRTGSQGNRDQKGHGSFFAHDLLCNQGIERDNMRSETALSRLLEPLLVRGINADMVD